jgi:molybdopterin-guanine dinucleotide biosynthesis protein B
VKVFGFAGYSGSGKTTMIEQVIPRLVMEGVRVSLIKHAHHDFDIDRPGKDSYRHREAGATEVLVSSGQRWVLMHELRGAAEPTLTEQLNRFSPCDLVVVEGFKSEPYPKIEIHRRATGKPLLYPADPTVVGIASDEPLDTALPQFGLEDYDAIAAFVLRQTGLAGAPGEGAEPPKRPRMEVPT